MSVSGVIP
ncbi:hypothetical protein AYI69_g7967, partial [Smittium culicis]